MRGLQVEISQASILMLTCLEYILEPNLQVVESLCANTTLMLGETLTGISKDMDLTSHRWQLYGDL